MNSLWRYATYGKFTKFVEDPEVVVRLAADFKKAYPGIVTWTRAVTDKLEKSK